MLSIQKYAITNRMFTKRAVLNKFRDFVTNFYGWFYHSLSFCFPLYLETEQVDFLDSESKYIVV